ncbi:MAG: hypothetical protein COB02_14025 [Candidatus Cloacimonadota bacterium]|nr:MAG: hypothetical protein COB02_14025 [Candidatus Cloacimonadota bacterium]
MKHLLLLLLFLNISNSASQKKIYITKILKKLYKKKSIKKQQEQLFTQIESNIQKGNELLFDDLMEWEKDITNLQEKYTFFKQLERKSLKKLKVQFINEIDIFQLILKVNFHLYNKAFTLSELKTLLNFYNTKAGMKIIKLAPKFVSKSQKLLSERLIPIATKIATKVQKEMVQEFINAE